MSASGADMAGTMPPAKTAVHLADCLSIAVKKLAVALDGVSLCVPPAESSDIRSMASGECSVVDPLDQRYP